MQIKRHKYFRKDELKAKLTDEQYKNMLIIYTVQDDVLYLQRISTHNQLFKKY